MTPSPGIIHMSQVLSSKKGHTSERAIESRSKDLYWLTQADCLYAELIRDQSLNYLLTVDRKVTWKPIILNVLRNGGIQFRVRHGGGAIHWNLTLQEKCRRLHSPRWHIKIH